MSDKTKVKRSDGISEILSGSPEDIAARIRDLSASDKLRLAADIVEFVPRLKGSALRIVSLAELQIRGINS